MIPIQYKKLLIIGDRNVGKSTFIQRMKQGIFIEEYIRTNSIEGSHILSLRSTNHNLYI